MDEGFDCPQADVHLTIPRAIADGVLRSRVIWDPDALGPGRGAYLERIKVRAATSERQCMLLDTTDARRADQPRTGRVDCVWAAEAAAGQLQVRRLKAALLAGLCVS